MSSVVRLFLSNTSSDQQNLPESDNRRRALPSQGQRWPRLPQRYRTAHQSYYGVGGLWDPASMDMQINVSDASVISNPILRIQIIFFDCVIRARSCVFYRSVTSLSAQHRHKHVPCCQARTYLRWQEVHPASGI